MRSEIDYIRDSRCAILRYRRKGEIQETEILARELPSSIQRDPLKDVVVDLTPYPVIFNIGGKWISRWLEEMKQKAPHAIIIAVESGGIGSDVFIHFPVNFSASRISVGLTEKQKEWDRYYADMEQDALRLREEFPMIEVEICPRHFNGGRWDFIALQHAGQKRETDSYKGGLWQIKNAWPQLVSEVKHA